MAIYYKIVYSYKKSKSIVKPYSQQTGQNYQSSAFLVYGNLLHNGYTDKNMAECIRTLLQLP